MTPGDYGNPADVLVQGSDRPRRKTWLAVLMAALIAITVALTMTFTAGHPAVARSYPAACPGGLHQVDTVTGPGCAPDRRVP